MGPVIEVRIVRIVGVHGFEVAVLSIKGQSTTSWVLTPRGKNRFVDEMEDPNISPNVTSINLLKEQANSEKQVFTKMLNRVFGNENSQ